MTKIHEPWILGGESRDV
ncbi:hypothetical protein J010_04749 [Cryptococcus neoformans]|nr:hypothetical protein C365_04551 [Cryptococcus neoformans var. grubii Bt85]OXG47560.1 hypothetical protein C355_04874 [Cryptococcus neoformans var. grubii Th84]OXH05912.1 hypothetical protein J010_04749 [Cryptococcus neoformans var. grubii]OXH27518.1 hypothetical protein J009_04770 [Cryptococcus neoformans var. grubii]OXH28453.1 hypothetical protein J005_04802 [Cryptococcus neoformans var. grubii]